MSAKQAQKAVMGWLKLDPNPLETPLGQAVKKVDVFADKSGETIYYVIYLQDSGFVIVSAEDRVEPIIAFVSEGIYDESYDNPLGALVKKDLPGRMAAARSLETKIFNNLQKKRSAGERAKLEKACMKAQAKWAKLQNYAETVAIKSAPYLAEEFATDSFESQFSISDLRAGPLVQSRWGQTTVCGKVCYNYYTPNNYPCGCVATAMAQLMRYHQHPARDDWGLMDLVPDCDTTLSQRQAIGELCHKAGVEANMSYASDGSGADMEDARDALEGYFDFDNAIIGSLWVVGNISSGLKKMLNPNLDAGYPTLLGLHSDDVRGHAVVCDGYGYNGSTLYHHLNMGWDGHHDAWYNLPDIDSAPSYNVIIRCVYNVFPNGRGEIISGRVTLSEGAPLSGVVVTAETSGRTIFSDTTDDRGIYALTNVPSNTKFTVTASKSGVNFSNQTVSTGTSGNGNAYTGNCWSVDFVGNLGPAADFTGDCIVDTGDFKILAGDWLESGSYVQKGTKPNANGLVLHYSFDGTLGSDIPSSLVDDTGRYTATIIPGSSPGSTIKYAGPNPIYNTDGTSAQFTNDNWLNNAGDTLLIPDSGGIDFSSSSEFTVELFINPSPAGSGELRRIFSEYIYAYMYLDTSNALNAIRKWGGGKWNENWTILSKSDFPMDKWSHVAMTWDSDAAGDKFKLYIDGELVGSDPGNSALTLDSTAGFAIGGYQREDSSTAQFFSGKIDEFRLYNYALSEDEIMYTANNGPVMILIPPDSEANLYRDEVIDFKDFADFASQWLDTCE